MNRIRLLSEQTANQIAAGEVVERPASVVKELVENSLDAGSTRISIEIQAGGRSLIRVSDDGMGMSRDDALMSLERHATSKISRAEELSTIASFGFRGEALPSIASVSRFTLTTRESGSNAPDATQVIVQGNRIVEVKSAAGPPGTSIEVRQIFFNLPARRKFLRSEETERAHIQHYLMLAALAHPGVGFSFVNDQRLVWQLPPASIRLEPQAMLAALKERMDALRGRGGAMLPIDVSGELAAWPEPGGAREPASTEDPSRGAGPSGSRIRIWGYIGAPGVSRSTREEQHLFVNRRPVENRGLNFALLEGYHTALMKGRYPVCALFLEIDPSAVDVNIHPSKREVKFHQENLVRRFVTDAVRVALLRWHGGAGATARPQGASATRAAEIGDPSTDRGDVPVPVDARPPATEVRSPAQMPLRMGAASQSAEPSAGRPLPDRTVEPACPPPAVAHSGKGQAVTTEHQPVSPPAQRIGGEAGAPGLSAEETPRATGTEALSMMAPVRVPPVLGVPLRLIGVIGRLYVVYESDRGMVLMDQHAAHERILFEQMLRRLEEGDAPSQRLLLPETVELTPRDAQFLRENMTVLTRLGVGLSEFGDRTFLLDGLPPFVKTRDARRFVLELVDDLRASGQGINALRLGEHTIAKTVCRHAIKANDPLAPEELEGLLADLRRCEMPYTCPHGRPTLIEMSYRELERKFGRAPM